MVSTISNALQEGEQILKNAADLNLSVVNNSIDVCGVRVNLK